MKKKTLEIISWILAFVGIPSMFISAILQNIPLLLFGVDCAFISGLIGYYTNKEVEQE